MKLCTKVVATTRQCLATMRASAPTVGTCHEVVLFKFAMSEYRQVSLQGCKGLVGTKLGLDKDLTPAQ